MSALGVWLREKREARGLSMRQAARAAGISQPYLLDIERGRRNPRPPVIRALKRALGVEGQREPGDTVEVFGARCVICAMLLTVERDPVYGDPVDIYCGHCGLSYRHTPRRE